MAEKVLQKLQVFYELAMSVGKSLDLDAMLKHSLLAYMRKLNCVCVFVYKINESEDERYVSQQIFSIPFASYIKDKYNKFLDFIPAEFTKTELLGFRNKLTMTLKKGNEMFFHVMQLGDYGFMVLIKNNNKIDAEILLALKEINSKLGMACEACENNKALIQSEERYKSMFYDNSSIMLLVDPNTGNIIDANTSASEFYKYSRETLKAMNIREINCLPDKLLVSHITNSFKGNKSYYKIDHKLANNEKRKVAVYSSKIYYKDKELLFSIIHDVSKQQTAEKDLVKAKERAEESDKLKTAFLANMSHEIRTPLNGIIGFSSLLQKRELAEKKKNLYVNIIINNSQQLLNIVNDILDVSRIESGTLDLDFEEVNLNELIMDLYSSYKSQYNQKVVSLFTHKELKDENSYVITDKLRLIQVLSNLLYNSFKFTHEGYIKFGYTLDNGFVKFFVEDTGIGISKKMHDKIFEPFRQAETGITRKYGGTGLGLSISKKIINLLGGEIGLKSKVGKGSEFYFTIPLKLVKQTKANLEQTITENEDRNTILLVEDKESNFLLIEEILSEINLKILHAKNGKEAVEICRTNKNLKLVLMDLKMPIMNGYEATKLIKKDNPSLPVIAQSAYAMKEEKNKAQEYGFDAYISKPISQENLFIYIDKYINKK